MIIDTHVHLNDEKYQDILDDVINSSIRNRVGKMIIIGYDKKSSIRAVEIASAHPFIYAAVGLHPSEVHKEDDLDLKWLYELLRNDNVIAIGEIGLDYYWDKTYIDLQKEMFIKQILIANEHNLPISIHSRDAIVDTYDILKEYRCKAVLHCYSGSYEMAKKFTDLGYYLGIGGVVTFKNNRVTKEVVEKIDLDYMITETDAPYLAPTPFRGKLNMPEYIKYVIEEIALLKDLSTEEVEKKIEENVEKIFNI